MRKVEFHQICSDDQFVKWSMKCTCKIPVHQSRSTLYSRHFYGINHSVINSVCETVRAHAASDCERFDLSASSLRDNRLLSMRSRAFPSHDGNRWYVKRDVLRPRRTRRRSNNIVGDVVVAASPSRLELKAAHLVFILPLIVPAAIFFLPAAVFPFCARSSPFYAVA